METTDEKQGSNWLKFTMLNQSLGQKLTTQEVAAYMGLDEDTVRKYYKEIGGIRLPGPKGRILFFEKNIVYALSRRNDYAFKDNEEWTDSMERESAEGRINQTKGVRHEEGGSGMGGQKKKGGLDEDRHGIFPG
jgi:hypothetical protein